MLHAVKVNKHVAYSTLEAVIKTKNDASKPRRKGPHVCSVKGKYNGSGGQGRRYVGAKAGFGCECKRGFLPAAGGARIKYAFKKDNKKLGPSIVTYTGDEVIPRGYSEALPCQESFLNKTSKTLKNYIKAHPETNLFKNGCQGVEDDLKKEKLVNHNSYDGDRAPELMPNVQGSDRRPKVFSVDNFIGINDFFKANQAADKFEKISEGVIEEGSPFNYSSVLGQFMAPAPADLKQSLLRELIDEKYFLEIESGKALHATAILIDLGFNKDSNRHFIKEIFPDYVETKFKSLETTVNIHLETYYFTKNKVRNNIFQNFEKAWSSLTTKQQNILKRTFLSEEKQTAKEIAKSLRIAESSVIDRKKKALASFVKHFPKLVPLSKQKNAYTKTELDRKELQLSGLFRLSNYEKLEPCKIKNYKTGKTETLTKARVKLKPEDPELKSEVWKWIDDTRPDIYPSDFN